MSRLLLVAVAVVGIGAAVAACAARPAEPPANAASWFPHERHLEYFTSGRHRMERVDMHVGILGGGEPPEAVTGGRCAECHDDLASRTACASCHVPFQNASLREQQGRPCLGCHGATWTDRGPASPRPETCLACHDPDRQPASTPSRLQRVALVRTPEPPARSTTMPANVYFSHRAHVRFGSIACAQCHDTPGAALERSPSRPFMTMTKCLQCHQENGASTDCLVCHK